MSSLLDCCHGYIGPPLLLRRSAHREAVNQSSGGGVHALDKCCGIVESQCDYDTVHIRRSVDDILTQTGYNEPPLWLVRH